MPLLNRFFITTAIGLSFPLLSNAAKLLIFDSSNMIMLRNHGQVAGYYSSVEGDKNCEFFFYQIDKYLVKNKEISNTNIKIFSFTFPPKSYQYRDRDRRFDSTGEVYAQRNQRIVHIVTPEPGCVGWAVGSFEKMPTDKDVVRYTVESEVEAIGIRAMTRKSFLYRKNGSRFDPTRMFLVMGDVVTVLKTANNYSYIRYANPDAASEKKIATGWVHSADLVNPFPSASEGAQP